MATDQHCLELENIDEFVHDENKIVTCKWLSLALKIHINKAKHLLYTFLQQQKTKDKNVNATYFVAGLYQDSNGCMEHKCLIIPEEALESTCNQMSVVTSCHVYSVQRSHLKDSSALFMTDYDGVREHLSECNKYSSIHCTKASNLRPKLAVKEKDLSVPQVGETNSQSNIGVSKTLSGSAGGMRNCSIVNAAPTTKPKKTEPKGSIATMFAQTNKKSDGDAGKLKENESQNKDKKITKQPAKKGGVLDFFSSAVSQVKDKLKDVPKTEPATPYETKAKSDASIKINTSIKTQSSESSITTKLNDSLFTTKSIEAFTKKKKTTRSTDDSDDDDQPFRKRRRRIKDDLFDSSSEEDVDVIPDSPLPSPEQEVSPESESPVLVEDTGGQEEERQKEEQMKGDNNANGNKLRRRRRKLVPKTYLDEDGFMVTEKVWESESTDASEVEGEMPKSAQAQKQTAPTQPVMKASPQKKASPAKGKQTSLMSFFKKK